MAILRRILFCFLALKTISAACSSNRTFTIRDTADTSALSICPTYTGDIAVDINMLGIVSLPKLETLHGSLMLYNNLGLSALRADSLSHIDDQLIVKNAQNLSTLALPKLSQVGDLILDSLPKLAELTIDVQNASNIYIGANRILGNTTLHVTEISQNFTLFKNGDQLKEFSMPDLDVIDGYFLVACNSHLAELELSSLEHVEKTMNIQGNPAMASLDIPELESVEGGVRTDSILDAPKLPAMGAVTDAPNPRALDCTVMRADSLPTLSLLTSTSLELADLDASRYSTNPDLTTNTSTDPNSYPSTKPNVSANANTDTNVQHTQNTGVPTLTKAVIAVSIVTGIILAGVIALCRFKVKRKLDKSRIGKEDEEEVIATEVHSVAKDGSKTVSTGAAITSLETASTTTLKMTALGLSEIPKPQKSHQGTKFRPVKLATPIALAAQPSPLPINFVAATPHGNTRLNGDQNSETERKGELDCKARSRSKSRGRLGQDLGRAGTAPRLLEPIEFSDPFRRTKSPKSPNSNDTATIIPSPKVQVPIWTEKKTTPQPPRLRLHMRSTSLDSSCMSVSSQPPRLHLNLSCSSAASSQVSLVEGSRCAVAESSFMQRLKPAVIHVRTPSPRVSGGFRAHCGCDPRVSGMLAVPSKRNSSV